MRPRPLDPALPIRAVPLALALCLGGCAPLGEPGQPEEEAPRAWIEMPAERAADADKLLEQYASTNRFRLGAPGRITPTPDGEKVLFLRSGPRSFVQDLYELDMRTGTERVLLTAAALLGGGEEHLTAEELARRERQRLASRGIVSFDLSKDGSTLLVPLSGKLYLVERASGRFREVGRSDAGYAIDPRLSPEGSRLACVRAGDLFVTTLEDGVEVRLTTTDPAREPTITNALAEFVAQEEMDRAEGYWWSPDGSALIYQRTDTRGMEMFHIADPMDPGVEPHAWPYPRAGKQNALVTLGVVASAGGETTWIAWDAEEYPYVARVDWPEHGPATLLVQNREQTAQALLEVDVASGRTKPLLVENDSAWINLTMHTPAWIDRGRAFLWMSESSGEWRLEKRARDGSPAGELTPAGFGLRELLHVDEDRGIAYVSASTDPVERHVWSVPLGGGEPRRLTQGRGVFSAWFGEKSAAWVQGASMDDGTQAWHARAIEGDSAWEIRSAVEAPAILPNAEWVTLAGELQMRAVVVRPTWFERGMRLPVLVSVYGGPHYQSVLASRRTYLLHQWFAELGYVVVSMDGRGTPSRGREWERAIKGDVISLPLQDQVDALRRLGARFAEMDLSRVGIYGWSFGGYFSAHAAMREARVFRAGVAGAPVADWRDYDTHYTERYMGLPQDNAAGYDSASVLTHGKELERPLLIIHGTADDNVYFLHSLKMTASLFREGRGFEFLPLAGFTHMVPDPAVTINLQRRVADFFDRTVRRAKD